MQTTRHTLLNLLDIGRSDGDTDLHDLNVPLRGLLLVEAAHIAVV
jgi:hypothetical protein